MKYLLVDSNNLSCRICFAQPELKNSDGIYSGLHFGFFQSLINLKQKFPFHNILLVWDGKSKRRQIESENAVKEGIVPLVYKGNRKKDEIPIPLLNFYEQAPFLKRALNYTGIPQIRYNEYEADDVISAYTKNLKKHSEEIVISTSDKDYYQLLDSNVKMWDGMKMSEITVDTFKNNWGIEPKQWVDVGSFCGDDSDGIYGVPGWGEKTSIKAIKKYETWDKVLDDYKNKYKDARINNIDLNLRDGGEDLFTYLKEKISEKGRFIYPEITFDMPYTGVLLAFDQDKINGSKIEIMSLMFEKRIRLAYSLKKMDDDIPSLPDFDKGPLNKEKLNEFFDFYDITTLKNAIDLFE